MISAKRSALTAWLCASAAPLAFAQELCLPEYDEAPADLPEPTLTPNENDAADEVEIIAPEINIGNESEAQFSGKVEIRWRDVTIAAENASFNRDNESLESAAASQSGIPM